MFFPTIEAEQRQDIARQVAELIDAFTSEGRLGGALIPRGLELHESCEELILDLPRNWKSLHKEGASMDQWGRRQQTTWYHQLRTEREVFGFARSIEVEGRGGGHRVIEVVPSTVADEFQKAVDFIDTDESEAEAPGSGPSAFLLHIPRYAFYSLATTGAANLEKKARADDITLVYPFFHQQLPGAERKMGRDSLASLLDRLPSVFGALGEEEEPGAAPNPEEPPRLTR